MSQLAELFVDRAAAAIMPSWSSWERIGDSRRDYYRALARRALGAVGLEAGSESLAEAARFLLRDQAAIRAAADGLPPAEVVTVALWLLVSLSDRGVSVARLLEWLVDSLAAGAGDSSSLSEILEER